MSHATLHNLILFHLIYVAENVTNANKPFEDFSWMSHLIMHVLLVRPCSQAHITSECRHVVRRVALNLINLVLATKPGRLSSVSGGAQRLEADL